MGAWTGMSIKRQMACCAKSGVSERVVASVLPWLG